MCSSTACAAEALSSNKLKMGRKRGANSPAYPASRSERVLAPQRDRAAARDRAAHVQEISAQHVPEGRARNYAVIRVIEGVKQVRADLEHVAFLEGHDEVLHEAQVPI